VKSACEEKKVAQFVKKIHISIA